MSGAIRYVKLYVGIDKVGHHALRAEPDMATVDRAYDLIERYHVRARGGRAWRMGHAGLARELSELRAEKWQLVRRVFCRLQGAYRAHADAVAVEYVETARASKGSARGMLQRRKELRDILVLILDSGRTSRSESRAIDFLKGMELAP